MPVYQPLNLALRGVPLPPHSPSDTTITHAVGSKATTSARELLPDEFHLSTIPEWGRLKSLRRHQARLWNETEYSEFDPAQALTGGVGGQDRLDLLEDGLRYIMRRSDLDFLLDNGLDEGTARSAQSHLQSLCALMQRNIGVPGLSYRKRQAQVDNKYYCLDTLLDYLAITTCEFVMVSGAALKLFNFASPGDEAQEIDRFNEFFDSLTQCPVADTCFRTQELPLGGSDPENPLVPLAASFDALVELVSQLKSPPDCIDCKGHEVLLRLPGVDTDVSRISFDGPSLEVYLSNCSAPSRWVEGRLEGLPQVDMNHNKIYPISGNIQQEIHSVQDAVGVRHNLLFCENKMYSHHSSSDGHGNSRPSGNQPSHSLKKLLENGAFDEFNFDYKGPIFGPDDKLVLAATIVSGLLLSSHLGRIIRCWDPETVYFLAKPNGQYIRNPPYATCEALPAGSDRDQAQKLDLTLEDADLQLLAKLLLEIRSGRLCDEVPSVDALNNRIFENLGHGPYLQAVHDCLIFRRLYQRETYLRAQVGQKPNAFAAAREVIFSIINKMRTPVQQERSKKRLRARGDDEEHSYPVLCEYGQLGILGGRPANDFKSTTDPVPANSGRKTPNKRRKVRFDESQTVGQREHRLDMNVESRFGKSSNCSPPPTDRSGFEIAIICALPLEASAVDNLLDRRQNLKIDEDPNAYTIGAFRRHNVVLIHMPGIGITSAASVAAHCRRSFPGIKLGLIVGICGGVPFTGDRQEILLGDVVISSGVVQYEFKKQYCNKSVRESYVMDDLGRHSPEIRAHLSRLMSRRNRKELEDRTSEHLAALRKEFGDEAGASYPGLSEDRLFEPQYRHKHQTRSDCAVCAACKRFEDPVCETSMKLSCDRLGCDETKLVPRSRLQKAVQDAAANGPSEIHKPAIHFGLVASGDTVMKSSSDRDDKATRERVIAFEMEGAGVWDNIPCLVIKGVCDYADSHKNNQWQLYAAAAAAASAKAFLEQWQS
ncbi:hypothetical protein TWF481_006071 [Arthrobotrys musiformis]|uniref:Nucleoside phosphorylase domain-containing protein n=1 Tax=Arthrobotrys musiformis TaxID=47236 RepID=A0AAV9WFK1_9PEZI